MRRWRGITLAAGLAMLAPTQELRAAQDCAIDAMVVFDGSGSMAGLAAGLTSERRIEQARRAMRQAAPGIGAARRVGLIVYGPGQGGKCARISLRFAPMPDAAGRLVREIDALSPSGETPLTGAVRMAAEVLDIRARAAIIVLVTDGKENCGGAPCEMAAGLASEARDLTLHVIGFQLAPGREDAESGAGAQAARCMAEVTGGRFVTAQTVDELAGALRETLGCALIGAVQVPGRRRPA